MKVCFFNTTKTWGGGENWHLTTAEMFVAEGHEVVIVANKDSELCKRAKALGINTREFSLGNMSFLNPFKRREVRLFFSKGKFDAVIFNGPADLRIAAPIARQEGVRRVVYRRGSDIAIKNSFLNRYVFSSLTDIIANSESTKRSILRNNHNLFPEDKIAVIYNGISFDGFENRVEEHDLQVIGTVGRLEYQKRHDLLVDVAARLKKDGVKCKVRIGGEGSLKEDIVKKIKELDVEDVVELTGFVNDAHEFLQHIDIFVLTSEWEGFGFVLVEAMRARKPIVAFATSSTPELVRDGENGKLVAWPDTAAFADAVKSLLSNKQLQKQYADRGYEIGRTEFNIENNKKKTIDFLN